jgi:hypothetical protein
VRGGDPGLEGEETTQAGFLDGRASDALERKGSQTAEPSMPAVQLGQESSLSGTPAPSVGNLPSQRAVPRALRGPARLRRRRGSPVHLLLRGALSSKKRVPTTPSAGLGLMQLVETLTLSRTKTQVNPPAAVPDIAKVHA